MYLQILRSDLHKALKDCSFFSSSKLDQNVSGAVVMVKTPLHTQRFLKVILKNLKYNYKFTFEHACRLLRCVGNIITVWLCPYMI